MNAERAGGAAAPLVLVTGASGGIGGAVARRLAGAGFALALSGRRRERLEKLAAECGGDGIASVHVLDLAHEGAPERLLAEVLARHGRLDLLLNNAGIDGGGGALEAQLADWQRALAVNLAVPMALCHAALPALRRSPQGCIVQIASLSAALSGAGSEAYAASKAGLVAFSGSLFESVRESGVKVCVILPGYVDTDMVTRAGLDRAKLLQPSDVAEAVLYAAASSATCCPTQIVLRPQRSPYLPS